MGSTASKALRYGPCVTRGSHSFTCHPHMNHTCLYSPVAVDSGNTKTNSKSVTYLRSYWQVRENGVGEWIVKSDQVKERTFTLTDIKEGSSYEFRVSAVNKAGQGPASDSSAKYGQSRSWLII